MPEIDIRPFSSSTTNSEILDAIRHDASPDYQRRIPEATKAGVQAVVQNLTNYSPDWNEFVQALINRIGLVIVKNNIWTNPLSKFKRGMLTFGDTIEEINVGLIKSHVYNSDRLNLERDIFGNYPPDVQTSYHKLNRKEYYPITVNEALLAQAFINDTGLSSFISAVMSAPSTSDQLDEFLLTCSLFPEYHRAGGFFIVNVPDIADPSSDAADAKIFARRLREMAGNVQFMNTYYNASGMPIAVDESELELFITPEAMAAMDVEALAAAFNIEKSELPGRTTIIPQVNFGIPGAQAVLTTRDFFVIADARIENASQWNPVALQTNNFFHHWEVISASRFVPAILFSSIEESTVITIEDTPVTSVGAITVTDEDGDTVTSVSRGSLYQVVGSAVTTPTGGDNDAIRLEVVGALSTHTFVKSTGVLHVARDEDATSLIIRAFAVDTDIPQLTAEVTVAVVGAKLVLWPEPHVVPDADNDGLFEVTPDAPIDEDDVVTVPNMVGVQYRKVIKEGVTFTDTGDIVTVPSHGAAVGDTIIFGAITTTTGVLAATTYYVKTVPTADTLTISATDGGATLALTTNGSAASAQFDVANASTHDIVGQTDFTAVAIAPYEITPGATVLWAFDN